MRPSQGELRRPMAIVFLGEHRDDASLHPCAVRHVLDPWLACVEMLLSPVLGQDREAAEVAEAIVIDRHDLAGYLMRRDVRLPLPWHGPGLRWRDLARVASQSGDQTFGQAEVSAQHR